VSQEATFSYTLKTPKAGNLFTARGDTADEFVANLKAAESSGALDLISRIETSLTGEPYRPRQQTREDRQELPAGFADVKCKTCEAPTRFDKEGVSQTSGKPYKRYLCSASALHKATFTE
jgi:hypothetical protein